MYIFSTRYINVTLFVFNQFWFNGAGFISACCCKCTSKSTNLNKKKV